jgi:hypothetical protein
MKNQCLLKDKNTKCISALTLGPLFIQQKLVWFGLVDTLTLSTTQHGLQA